jgi:phage terminase small subunit
MGKNRTPTAVLDAKGAFGKNPNRQRNAEPTTDQSIGNPPTHLSQPEKKIWRELTKQALPGVLKYSDRAAFELLVRLTSTMRTDYATMRVADKSLFVSLCSRFALTPADRSKVAVEQPKKSNLQAFLTRKAS